MKRLIQDNYKSIVKRGLITDKTTQLDFYHKIDEEINEFLFELMCYEQSDTKISFELADIILSCLAYAKHYNIDIEYFLKEKIKINYKRADKD